jgi:hypothetical protein
MAGRDGPPDDPTLYRQPRTIAGLALVGLVMALALIHALQRTAPDPIELGLFLGAALLLFGIRDRLR